MYDEEKVIDLKDMLYRTCICWRSICIAGLIGFICSLLINITILIQLWDAHSNNALIKVLIKYGVLGFMIGVILAILWRMVMYAFSDKIYLPEDLCQKYGINLIGVIPRNKKKKKSLLDCFIRKVFGVKISEELQESLAERTAEEILILAVKKGKEWPDIPVVALVSSYSTDISAALGVLIEKKLKRDIRIVNAGNILQDARSIRMADRADFVVIVEKQGFSSFKEYKEACGKLILWGKDVLGVVLIDVI